ncbi:MAG: RNA polymerase sigma factor [Candidatus Aminicenantaceae bacterium]
MERQDTAEQAHIHALVLSAREGDREAFKAITRLYQKKVYLLAYSFFRNNEDAMDIVQETFLRFYQKAAMFEQGKSFQNWLLQIAKNLCIDHYRKQHKKDREFLVDVEPEEVGLDRSGPAPDPSSATDLKDVFGLCLSRLSERQRMIFVMRHYNQLHYTEIAQILNIAVGTVKSLNFKAIQNLKAHMSPYVGAQP